jgi:hypothetical protein
MNHSNDSAVDARVAITLGRSASIRGAAAGPFRGAYRRFDAVTNREKWGFSTSW